MKYDSQTPADVEAIERVLNRYACRKLRFLEVGTYQGSTARAIKEFCDNQGTELEYWGIDSGAHPTFREQQYMPRIPFPDAHMVIGDSAEVFHLVPPSFDVVFLDGCHCFNHVVLDTLHYGDRVTWNGYLMYHDTDPRFEQTMRDPHGPENALFSNSVNAALEALRMMDHPNWRLAFPPKFEPEATFGGITVFQHIA